MISLNSFKQLLQHTGVSALARSLQNTGGVEGGNILLHV